jgi:hypothetical protein
MTGFRTSEQDHDETYRLVGPLTTIVDTPHE